MSRGVLHTVTKPGIWQASSVSGRADVKEIARPSSVQQEARNARDSRQLPHRAVLDAGAEDQDHLRVKYVDPLEVVRTMLSTGRDSPVSCIGMLCCAAKL